MTSISTQTISSNLRQAIVQMQSDLTDAQTAVATGHYADIGLHLGADTGKSLSLRSEQNNLQSITQTNNIVSTRMTSTQNVLDNVMSTAQGFLQQLAEEPNGTMINDTIPTSANADLQYLTSSMNTSIDNEYIFGGENSQTAPMTEYTASPDSANRTAVVDAFQSAFGMAPNDPNATSITPAAMTNFLNTTFASQFQGSNWTTNWCSASSDAISTQISPSDTLDTSVTANQTAMQQIAMAYTMVSEFGGSNYSSTTHSAVISAATQVISKAIASLTNVQASLGISQAALTNANTQMSIQMDVLTNGISDLESVNPEQASTTVSSLQTQIEASYQLTAALQKLSLVNYL